MGGILITYLEMCAYLTIRYVIVAAIIHWYYWKRNPAWTRRYRLQEKEFNREELRREIILSLKSGVVAAIFTTFFQDPYLRSTTQVYWNPLDKGVLWLVASYWFLLIAHDTYFYWAHRLLHCRLLFGLTHRMHHLSLNPSAFAAFSFGVLESFINFAWILPLLYLVPLNFWLLHTFSLVALVTDLMGHSGVSAFPVAWRRHPLMGWVNTPFHHNMHHQKIVGNFGLYFTFWDRLMGTLVES